MKIIKREHAFEGFASTYNVEILNSLNPKLQLKSTESAIKIKLIEILTELKDFKFVTTLVLVFKKIENKDKTKLENFYSNSKAEIIINESDIDNVFQSFYTTIITNIQKSLGEGSGWITDLVIDHTISISKYNPLARRSYIKLPKELNHPRKRLINIQNIDKKCFKWCLVRYLNPADHNLKRIAKSDDDFAKKPDFKDMKFPVKIRDIHKIGKKNSIGISVFGYINKEKYAIYVSKKCCEEKHVHLLLIGKGVKKNTMFLSKISIHSCMIIHCIVEENIFVVIFCMLSLQKKF